MAQNISLQGATYSDVPAVILPKSGGGTAPFTDVTDTTATASDVATGKYFYTASGVRTEGSVTARTSTDLSASGGTVSVPAGLYSSNASKAVASGTEGTPSATKGTVSNHSVTVTPSVTNAAGYISGGTHTGAGVTVLASELVSGSETKTANGTYDVTNLAELIVNVAGSGGLEYETGTYTHTSDVSRITINFSKTHSDYPVLIAMSDQNDVYATQQGTNVFWVYFDPYRLFGKGYSYSTSAERYGVVYFGYQQSSSVSVGNVQFSHTSDETGSSDTSYPRYWVSKTKFYPYANSSTRYWRKNRIYKWIAVWKPTT